MIKQLTREEMKAKLSHFNGKIFVDPNIEVGDKVILDQDYINRDYVIVMQLGEIFAKVKSGALEWATMRNRLTSLENGS